MIEISEIDFVANAFIAAMKNYNRRSITLSQLNLYREAVLRTLNSSNMPARGLLGYSKSDEEKFEIYFSTFADCGGRVYMLKDGITSFQLWGTFRNYLSYPVQKIFDSEECYKYLQDPSLLNPNLEVGITTVKCTMGDSEDWEKVPGLISEDKEELNKIKNTVANIQSYLDSLNNGYNYKVELINQNIFGYTEEFIVASAKRKEMTRVRA